MPILINPPAKVEKNSMIHTIINNLTTVPTASADGIDSAEDIYNLSPIFTTYSVVTLENYKLRFEVDNNGVGTIQILNRQNGTTDSDGNQLVWNEVLKPFGKFRNNISQVRFKTTNNPGAYLDDIIGTLSTHPTDSNKFIVTLDQDTVPANTQSAVDAVIDPQLNYPGDGTITAPVTGDRYLLLNDIPQGSVWSGISADKNDIIEYNGTNWTVTFDASNNEQSEHWTYNTYTNDKLKWTGSDWINGYEGTYNAGFWRLYL
jgi:hypothetical protein